MVRQWKNYKIGQYLAKITDKSWLVRTVALYVSRPDAIFNQRYSCTNSGGPPPLLTGCILNMVKILHKNTSFLLEILKNFREGEGAKPLPQTLPPTLSPPILKFWIRRCVRMIEK